MVQRILTTLMILLGFSASSLSIADVLVIEKPDTVVIEKPQRGDTMETVQAEFGEPNQVLPAVGEPPITRWIYPDFIVYFEHEYVIHAVSE